MAVHFERSKVDSPFLKCNDDGSEVGLRGVVISLRQRLTQWRWATSRARFPNSFFPERGRP
jgi:hypothetical protein